MSETVKKRKDWVDALRALAMILVIYGHRVPGWSEYFVFTSPIKIPLFFAITGYVFNRADGDVVTFLKKLLRTIVIPWLALTIVPYLAATPIKDFSFLRNHVKSILLGNEYWYMPCCIVAEIIWFFVLKTIRKTWQVIVSVVVLYIVGIVFHNHQILSAFMINRAMAVQLFFLIGWLFRKYEVTIIERLGKAWALGVGGGIYIALGILSLVLYPGQVMDVHLNEYYSHVICQLMIWIGIGTLFALAAVIKKYPKWWVMIGQNTLVIYLFHSFAVRAGVKAFNVIHLPVNRMTNILLTAIATAVCLSISLLINRFLPELMGKKRRT